MMPKVMLLDVDGVLSVHPESYSRIYARKKGIDYKEFRNFFQTSFQDALIGKADLKELIKDNDDIWGVGEDVDKLLEQWFEAENMVNMELVELVKEVKSKGIPCYIATNQEKYRSQYIVQTMFPELFDGIFASALVGSKKPYKSFFQKVMSTIKDNHPGIVAQDVLFVDDSPEHITGAAEEGINAHLYRNVKQVRGLLRL